VGHRQWLRYVLAHFALSGRPLMLRQPLRRNVDLKMFAVERLAARHADTL